MRRTDLKVGIYEFTGCAGDALAIIHSEDELVDFFTVVNVSSFLMAKRDNVEEKLDVALIEGSITTEEQKEKLMEIASRSKKIFAIGICACFGGIQAMKMGLGGWEERFKKVYGKDKISVGKAFESRPIDDFVKVDGYIPGCPIDAKQFFPAFTRIINGNNPELYGFPVCIECKWKGNQCLLVKNMLCLGPLTAAGCGGACPSYNIPCVGCWGPYEEANLLAQYHLLLEKGFKAEDIERRVRNFGGKRIVEYLKQLGNVT